MFFSEYVHLIKGDDFYAIYHAITTKVFLIDKAKYELLISGVALDSVFTEGQLGLLSQKGFLQDEREFDATKIVAKNAQQKPNLFAMYLILTEQCNMNCEYCSQSAFRTRDRMKNMSIDTIREALDRFYASKTQRRRTIVLYGGEPTLNKAGVLFAVDYIRNQKNDPEAEIVIFTNGILLDNDFIDSFKINRVDVIISIDGDREINDAFRIYKNGGSYDLITKAMAALDKHGIKYGISAVIGSHNVEMLDDVVVEFCETHKPFSIGLNPLHYVPNGREHISVDWDIASQRMIDAYKIGAERGVYIEQIMRRVRPFVLSTPRLKDCPACGGMLRVLPDGSFGPCGHFMEEFKEHDRREYVFEESAVVNKWNGRTSISIADCRSCKAIALCGGGCPYNSYKNGGDIFTANDKRSCAQAEAFLMWLIATIKSHIADPILFYEVTASDKLKLLKNIDLTQHIPLERYSRYGEFLIDEQYC